MTLMAMIRDGRDDGIRGPEGREIPIAMALRGKLHDLTRGLIFNLFDLHFSYPLIMYCLAVPY